MFRRALCGGALRERTIGLGAALRGTALRLGSLQGRTLGGRLFRGGAKLLLGSPLLGRAPLLDRTVHRRALIGRPSFFLGAALGRGATRFLGASFVFRAALDGCTLFSEPTLGRDALFFRAALGCGLLDGGTFRGSPFRRRGLLAGAKLFLLAPLHRGLPLLDRTLERRVLGRGALLLFGTALLSETPLLRGALGRGAVLGRAPFVELAGFGCRAAFRGCAFRGRVPLFFGAPLFGNATIFRGARFGRAHFDGDALLFREACFLRRAPFFNGAQFHRHAFGLDASRLFREPFLFRVPRERGVVDGGEGLFVFEDREGLVILLLRRRPLRDLGGASDGLIHGRPRFLDARRRA